MITIINHVTGQLLLRQSCRLWAAVIKGIDFIQNNDSDDVLVTTVYGSLIYYLSGARRAQEGSNWNTNGSIESGAGFGCAHDIPNLLFTNTARLLRNLFHTCPYDDLSRPSLPKRGAFNCCAVWVGGL